MHHHQQQKILFYLILINYPWGILDNVLLFWSISAKKNKKKSYLFIINSYCVFVILIVT